MNGKIMSDQVSDLFTALANITGEVSAEPTGRFNQGAHKYKYYSMEDAITACKDSMKRHGVSVTPIRVQTETVMMETKKGAQPETRVIVDYLVSHRSGQWIIAQVPGAGRDYGDKGIYKAMSGAQKYLFRQLFSIANNEDDPDKERIELSQDSRDGKEVAKPGARKPSSRKSSGRKTSGSTRVPSNFVKWAMEHHGDLFENEYEAQNSLKKLIKEHPEVKDKAQRFELWKRKIDQKRLKKKREELGMDEHEYDGGDDSDIDDEPVF